MVYEEEEVHHDVVGPCGAVGVANEHGDGVVEEVSL